MDYLAPPDRLLDDDLLLRSLEPGDGAALFEAVDASRAHLAPWMPWVDQHGDAQDSERYCRQSRGRWLLSQDFVIGIFDAASGRVLGTSGFHLRHGPVSLGIAEIGMWIRADAAGRHLGRRVLGLLLAWGFRQWPWQRIVWQCDVDNLPSRRVAEACGLRLEGVFLSDDLKVDRVTRRDTAFYAAVKPG